MLNDAEHGLKAPVEVILMLFSFANAGVLFSSWERRPGGSDRPSGGQACRHSVLWLAGAMMRLGLPEGMQVIDLLIIGFAPAAIGFTVSLFIARWLSRRVWFRMPPKWARCSRSGRCLSLSAAKVIGVNKISDLFKKHRSPALAVGGCKPAWWRSINSLIFGV